jgi:hypothetical protein
MSDRGKGKDDHSMHCESVGSDRIIVHCQHLHAARQRHALRRWMAEREQRRQRLRGESGKEVDSLRVRVPHYGMFQAIELTLDDPLRLEFGLPLPPRCAPPAAAAAVAPSAQSGCPPAAGGPSFDLSWCSSPLPLLPWFWSVHPLRNEDRGFEPLLSFLKGGRHGRQPEVAAVAQPLVLTARQLTEVDREMLRQEAMAEANALHRPLLQAARR